MKNWFSRNQQADIIYWITYIDTSSPAGVKYEFYFTAHRKSKLIEILVFFKVLSTEIKTVFYFII